MSSFGWLQSTDHLQMFLHVGPGQFANSAEQLCSIDSSAGSGKLQVREVVWFIFVQHIYFIVSYCIFILFYFNNFFCFIPVILFNYKMNEFLYFKLTAVFLFIFFRRPSSSNPPSVCKQGVPGQRLCIQFQIDRGRAYFVHRPTRFQ